MFSDADEKYLIRLLGRNEVVLFLGSGFSRGAKNKSDENYPTGYALADKIWQFLNFSGKYDGTSLPEMYQAFLNSGKKRQSKIDFLNANLLSGEIPEIYNYLSIPYWYKIYTTNIDDLPQKIYLRGKKLLQELKYPDDEYRERDQSLEKSQIIYLHGKLPCNPEDVIFSNKQYAKATLVNQPLYGQFVFDYATHAVIFVGSELNEPLFESYIESREGRGGYAELRPKSFLISPSLSQVKITNLKSEYNVHHIKGTTEDFLNWINKIKLNLPERTEILKVTFPSLINMIEMASLTGISSHSIKEFASSFLRVPTEYKIKSERSAFLLGANPTWNDIFREIDVPRTITSQIQNFIDRLHADSANFTKQQIISITGSAGSGKSTIIKRLGLTLSQSGYTVFISDSDYVPKPEHIVKVLSNIKDRVILIFDNAKNVLPQLNSLIKAFLILDFTPLIILSLRSNQTDKLNYIIDPDVVEHTFYTIPDLNDNEINNLISKLDSNNLLGKLKGLSAENRFREFRFKAKKQILVAMKEATQGKPFEEIIRDEFSEIEPSEAKLLCLCVALNTELGYTNTKQDFVGFSEVSHLEALSYLNRNLTGIIMWSEDSTKFMIRHKMLADFMITHCVSLEMLKTAYIRVLSVLSPELKYSHGNPKKFNLYKSLINHQILYARFKKDIEHAREVYDSLAPFFDNDAHFWLQYGCLEMEGDGGDLNLAENYINQAESLDPYYSFIQNAKCTLYYKLCTFQTNYSHAVEYKDKADDLARELLRVIGNEDPHISHIYCKGVYGFIKKWIFAPDTKKKMLKELKIFSERAVSIHPRDTKLASVAYVINKAYLQLGSDYAISDPDIPE